MNNEGELKVVEAAIDENISMQQKSASEFNDLKNEVQANFSTLYDINKMTRGLDGLKKRTTEIADGVERISFINKTHLNNFVGIDLELAKKIDQLEMSHDFVGNNSMETNSYNKVILGKVDGKSVNAGAKTTEQVEKVGESSIAGMQALTDITKGATVEQHAKEIEGITKEDSLADITKGATVEQHAKEIEGITKEDGLADITKGATVEQHAQEIQGINGVSLGNINNGNNTTEQHVQEIQGINGVSLGNINNGNNTTEQHAQEIRGINGVSLGNINNGNSLNNQEINSNYSVKGQVNLSNINKNGDVGSKVEFDASRF